MTVSKDVERYLAAGGRINVIPGVNPKPRGPHRQPPPKQETKPDRPKRARIPEWGARDRMVSLIRKAGLTQVDISKLSGVPVKRLAMHLDGTFNPKPEDARRIEEAVIQLATPKPRSRRK